MDNNEISIVYYLIDFQHSHQQLGYVKALAEVKKATGKAVHILWFSSRHSALLYKSSRLNDASSSIQYVNMIAKRGLLLGLISQWTDTT